MSDFKKTYSFIIMHIADLKKSPDTDRMVAISYKTSS